MPISDQMQGIDGTQLASAGALAAATGGASLGTTAAIMVGGQVLGGLLGGILSSGDTKKADRAFKEAEDIINQTGAPPNTAREIILEKFRAVGLQSPEIERAVDIGVSKMAQYQEDPRLREAGVNALQRMMKQAEGGLTAQDRLALRQIETENQRAVQGKIAQIQQEQQMRGMGGAGAGLAAQLSAAQAGAERGLTSGLQVGANATERALQALSMGAGQAQSLRGADLASAQATRGAEDEFQRFRAQEAIGRQQRNVAEANQAQREFIERTQGAWDKNTIAANREQERIRTAEGTDWERGFELNKERAGMRTGIGNRSVAKAAATQQSVGDITKGAVDIYGTASMYDYLGNKDKTKV